MLIPQPINQLKFISPISSLLRFGIILVIIFIIPARLQPVQAAVSTDPNFKVAFIGDTNDGSGFQNVLDLIKREGADLVLHQGDFSYNGTTRWTNMINNTLGSNFPYLGSVGNHDSWSAYAPFFKDRVNKMGFDPNIVPSNNSNYALTYRGLHMVFNKEGGDASFTLNNLQNDNHIWKVCSWHHNRKDFQAGGKGNDVSLQTYENCLDYGAIVATGHEHSYSRTCTLNNSGTFSASNSYGATCNNPALLNVGPQTSFIFVSGLGGGGIRDYHASEHDDDGWWSTIYTSNRYCMNTCTKVDLSGQDKSRDISSYDYTHGALFITFYVDGNPNKAKGYFKTVKNEIVDDFTVYADAANITPPPATPTPPTTVSAKGILAGYGTSSSLLDQFTDGLVNLLDLLQAAVP